MPFFASEGSTSDRERDDISDGNEVRLLQEQLLQKDNDYSHHDNTNKTFYLSRITKRHQPPKYKRLDV